MQSDDFAYQFELLFRLTYALAARRIRDKRERLTSETLALLEHLAMTGPATLGELTRHFDRAPSTLSEMIEPLVAKGLIARDRDPADGRRFLLWLSPQGQAVRMEEQNVLDQTRLKRSAGALSPQDRTALIDIMGRLTANLRQQGMKHDRDS